MIPLQYRLRRSVRLEQGPEGACRAISPAPLNVVAVNAAAARLLQRARTWTTVTELSLAFRVSEQRIFALCERFRACGILEVERARTVEAAVAPAAARAGRERQTGPATGLTAGASALPSSEEALPSVSVVIPTLDRAGELEDCLRALDELDYPRERLDVIVVDDGSAAPAAVAAVAARHRARLLVNDRNRGPAYSRNRGVCAAAGQIVAFIDSDCVAKPRWLLDLAPYFAWAAVGAVGGRTIGYYTESPLDRYEEVSSPLDMGSRLRIEGRGTDTFYVPTCNLLVRKSAFEQVGGLRDDLQVGEDVDLCWRLRASGYNLVYAPEGIVRHKHRDHLVGMLRRRADYGTSEATLHRLHPAKRKRLPLPPAPTATVALVACATLRLDPRLLLAALVPPAWDGVRRTIRLRRQTVNVSAGQIWSAVLRNHLGMLYFACFHLQRYYLLPLALAGPVAPGAWALGASAVVYSAGVDYRAKRPRLGFATYLAYYAAEHLAYQTGVIVGCLRERTLRSYLLALR